MSFPHLLISAMTCLMLVACGDQATDSNPCFDGTPCMEANLEQALAHDSFNQRFEISPTINLDHLQQEATTEGATMSADEVAALCNTSAEEVIADCLRAKRSSQRCELRGSWVYSGCKVEMAQATTIIE